MSSMDGRWVIAFNGEIYNHASLRHELRASGHTFRSHADTAVLVEAIAAWGIEEALHRCNAMLAFAAWDRQEGVLWLARDRVGKKPLYYGWTGDGTFVFASELAAIRACPSFDATVDADALALLLRLDYIPAPHSIFKGIYKLEAGSVLRIDTGSVRTRAHAPRTWWSAREHHDLAIRRGFDGDDETALDRLDSHLRRAVSRRMHADVPLGVLLSGGTDSSLVTAAMQAQSNRPVRTFAVGFDGVAHDESARAAAIARHLGTAHTEARVDGRTALDVVPRLPTLYDEPFADSSQVPMAILSTLARQEVTVALSGDGGDELFFGYRRYARAMRSEAWLRYLPRHALAGLHRRPDERARLGGLAALRSELACADVQGVARNRVSRWRHPEQVIHGSRRHMTAYDDPSVMPVLGGPAEALMFMDFTTYLSEGVLTKVDRASMAVGLEVRSPFLDHDLIEFAWSLPLAMKWRGREQKFLPRQLLKRHLPASLVDGPKNGFGAPVGPWLRGPLRDWAEAQISEHRLRIEGHFDVAAVRGVWAAFLAGEHKWHTHLWNILMFQAWSEATYG